VHSPRTQQQQEYQIVTNEVQKYISKKRNLVIKMYHCNNMLPVNTSLQNLFNIMKHNNNAVSALAFLFAHESLNRATLVEQMT